jgi:phosphoribosylglycinamide formyltransferase-1
MKRIVIFASGSGTNAENLISFFNHNGRARVVLVLSNNTNSKVLERAQRLNLS